MSVNHRRANVRMPEQLLYGSYVIAVLQEVGCERMPERVRASRFRDICFQPRLFDGLLEDRFVKVWRRFPPVSALQCFRVSAVRIQPFRGVSVGSLVRISYTSVPGNYFV